MRGPFRKEFAREDRPRQMRTVPVEQSVAPGRSVPSYDSIREIVEDLPEPLAVMHCVCRQSKDLLGEPCGRSPIRECCMMFGSAAESVLQKGIPSARRITRAELTGLLDLFQEAGFVLQAENARRPVFLCACCPCCCDALAGYRFFPRPSDIVASNYLAAVDPLRCSGCGACVKRCPMDAVAITEGTAHVDEGRCIGCGVCVAACRPGAIALKMKDRAAVPPATHDALYRTILLKKVGMAGFLKLLLKLVTLRKV
ncbi:MAG: 4Fe-4S binding protein [Spirochaetes bacterium]|nr:4Fe-4S binding protein [Spirochaetota bacterium]